MPRQSSLQDTKKEYGRGIIGGILFALPLLYTMEVWWRGFTASPAYLLAWIIATYLLLLGYNTYAGMRRDVAFREVFWDSFEEIGLAVIVTFCFLLLIGKITFEMPLYEIAGKVVVESMLTAIGISVGTAQLGKKSQKGSGSDVPGENNSKESLRKLFVLAVCGAVLVASPVAPTEEILIIATEVDSINVILMAVVSLLFAFAILYMIDFTGTKSKKRTRETVGAELAMCYFAALLVAAGLLFFFGRFDNRGLWIIVAQTIVLGIPASLGASAGRLLIAK